MRWIRGPQMSTIEIARAGRWVDDGDLLRYFECFGGCQLDVFPLGEEEARSRAAVLGVPFAASIEEYLEGAEHRG